MKYKLCREREDHTGGGDGDTGDYFKTISHKTLDEFEDSELYELIHSVYVQSLLSHL